MKLGYFDEAFTEGIDDWFLLGGLILDENSWEAVKNVERALDDDVQEKISGLEDLADPSSDIPREDRRNASDKVYQVLNFLDYTPITIIVDQKSALHWSKVDEPSDIYNIAFANLIERYQMILQNPGPVDDDYGILFIDERDDKSFRDLRNYHYELKESGTDFVNPENVAGVAAPLRDDKSNGMALADWMVSAAGTHLLKGNSRYYEYI
ncbi:hypothetical protein DJ71_07725, partial [Halorubrum sp. E3]